MNRLEKIIKGETAETRKPAAGMFDKSELERIAKLLSKFGMNNRSDFIHDCVMDGVDKLEAANGAKDDKSADPPKGQDKAKDKGGKK